MRAFARYYNKTLEGNEINESMTITSREDSQVLILTEKCFINLAQASKLSVAHLTQVILSRFKRATIPIIFEYLNLTGFASSFLGYFIKKSQGSNDIKMAELLNACQEGLRGQDDKLLRVILQYLIGSFDLDHTEFIPIETSPSLLRNHIQIITSTSKQPDQIIQELDQECRGAFLVLEGNLRLSFERESESSKFIDASVGDFVGVVSALMGKCSPIQVNQRFICYFSHSPN